MLIADDNDGVRLMLRTLLELEPDFSVVGEARDGLEVVALAETSEPELLLLDLAMPGLDGLEVMERLRESRPALKIVLYSGHCSPHVQQTARDLGAREFVVKGGPPEELFAALRRVAKER